MRIINRLSLILLFWVSNHIGIFPSYLSVKLKNIDVDAVYYKFIPANTLHLYDVDYDSCISKSGSFEMKEPSTGDIFYLKAFIKRKGKVVLLFDYYLLGGNDSIVFKEPILIGDRFIRDSLTNKLYYSNKNLYSLQNQFEVIKSYDLSRSKIADTGFNYIENDPLMLLRILNQLEIKLRLAENVMINRSIYSDTLSLISFLDFKYFLINYGIRAYSFNISVSNNKLPSEEKGAFRKRTDSVFSVWIKKVVDSSLASYSLFSRGIYDLSRTSPSIIKSGFGVSLDKLICTRFYGESYERFITVYLINSFLKLNDGEDLIKHYLPTLHVGQYRISLENILANMSKGGNAYDFSLQSFDGSVQSLSNFRGNVVLIDFWFTGCAACASMYKSEITKIDSAFGRRDDFKIISISVDSDVEVWKRSVTGQTYSSLRSVNLFGGGKKGAVVKNKYNVVAFPSFVLIGRDGEIVSYLRDSKKMRYEIENALK